jgi:hypothetical protein
MTTHDDTVVLDKDYISRSQDAVKASCADASGEIEVDGVKFRWWAAAEPRMRVTVRSPRFGSAAKVTKGDPATIAAGLARRLLDADRLGALAAGEDGKRQDAPLPDPMKKPGWFQT